MKTKKELQEEIKQLRATIQDWKEWHAELARALGDDCKFNVRTLTMLAVRNMVAELRNARRKLSRLGVSV